MSDNRPEHENGAPLAFIAVIVTIAFHLWMQRNGPNIFFIVGASGFWLTFLLWNAVRHPRRIRGWGFRTSQLSSACRDCLFVFAIVALSLMSYAFFMDRLRFPASTVLLLAIYPGYGWVQQFLALGIVWSTLAVSPFFVRRQMLAAVVVAALFAAVHLPDPAPVAGTFALELVLIHVYVRWRNLWPIGVLHGWSGALFYLWFEGRDMVQENVRMLHWGVGSTLTGR